MAARPGLIRTLFLISVLLFTVVPLLRAEGTATVIARKGGFQIARNGAGGWSTMPFRVVLRPGDRIQTGPGASGLLAFSDAMTVSLSANTLVIVYPPSAAYQGRALITILVGEARIRFSPSASHRLIGASTAVIAVYGTDLDVQVTPDGTAALTVVAGTVRFSNAGGSQIVRTGQGSVARPGQAPTPPAAVNVPLVVEWTLDLQSMLPPFETKLLPGTHAAAAAERTRLERLVRSNRADGPTLLRLAAAQHDLGDFDRALATYRAAALTNADPQAEQVGEAQTDLDSGNPDAAAVLFNGLLNAAPPQSPVRITALRGLTLAAIANRNDAAASAAATQLGAQPGGAAVSRTLLGRIAIQGNRRDEALIQLRAAVAADPQSSEARSLLSLVELDGGQAAEALAEGRRAAALSPDSSLAHAVLSQAMFYSGDLGGAGREARLAVDLNDLSGPAQLGLGEIELSRGHIYAAVAAGLKSAALDRQSARAHSFLGLALAEARRDDEAVQELQEAIRLDPNLVEAQTVLVRVYVDMGQNAQALQLAQEITAAHPHSAPAHASLAAVYRRTGHLRESITELETALQDDPGSAALHAQIARDLLDQNRLAEALVHAQKAVALQPSAGPFYAVLGLVYDRMQSGITPTLGSGAAPTSEQAERAYREAIALYPEGALARVNLAFEQLSSPDQPNPDFYFAEIAQGLLRDPSVTSEIYRPGISTGIIPAIGTQSEGLSLINREQGMNGRVHAITYASGQRMAGELPNSREDGGVLTGYYSMRPDSATNLLADVRLDGFNNQLPGAAYRLTPHSSTDSSLGQVILGLRRRVVPGQYLWAALRYRNLRANGNDPDAITNGTYALASHVGDELGGLEFRWDGQLTDRFSLSAGGSLETEALDFSQRFYDPTHQEQRLFSSSFSDTKLLGWTQAQLEPARWLSVIAGYRYQQITSGPHNPTLGSATTQVQAPLLRLGASGNLPYGMITLRPDRRVQLRLIAIQAQETGITPSLVPQEVFEIAEVPAITLLGRADTREVDLEAQPSAKDFVRLFSFSSRASSLPIGPDITFSSVIPTFTIERAQLQGVGVRYERQITPLLSGYARWLFHHDTDESTAVTNGSALPLSPLHTLTMGVNYVDRQGYKVRLTGVYRGEMYQDRFWSSSAAFQPGAARPRSGGVWVSNLRIGREASLRGEISLEISNLFDESYSLWPGLPAPGRGARLQYEWRF